MSASAKHWQESCTRQFSAPIRGSRHIMLGNDWIPPSDKNGRSSITFPQLHARIHTSLATSQSRTHLTACHDLHVMQRQPTVEGMYMSIADHLPLRSPDPLGPLDFLRRCYTAHLFKSYLLFGFDLETPKRQSRGFTPACSETLSHCNIDDFSALCDLASSA